MSSKKPQKPTWPVGYAIFSKDGSVKKVESLLPSDKEGQEKEVAQIFARQLRLFFGHTVSDPVTLPERDHDAAMTVSGKPVVLQIVEIAQRELELPPGSIDPGDPKCLARISPTDFIVLSGSEDLRDPEILTRLLSTRAEARAMDTNKINSSILLAIQRKLAKRYSAVVGSATWLLIFTTSPFIYTENERDGELIICEPLRRAREFLSERSSSPFDEIWLTHLVEGRRPTKVWPRDESSEKAEGGS